MVSTLDSVLLYLPVLLNGLSPVITIVDNCVCPSGFRRCAQSDSRKMVQNLNLESEPCSPVRVTIANGDTMSHSNRQV